MSLLVRPLRFEFQARDAISFPPGKAANIFRGAFGDIFRRVAANAAYARMFAPRAAAPDSGPSGFQDKPRPFVLRAAPLDGKRFDAGEHFTLEINVFDPEVPALDYFRRSFEELGREGLGPGRPLVDLLAARELPGISASLALPPEPVSKITVDFLTPTELKSQGEILREAPFGALFSRARDRVSSLMALYQGASETLDFRALGERAIAIRLTNAQFQQHEHERRSARTGQVHSLGGFTGHAEYEGNLTEFLPWLEAAVWTGVGRLTVWGNGLIHIREIQRGGIQ